MHARASFLPTLLMLLAVLVACPSTVRAAEAVEKLSSAWMGEYETFIVWHAKQKGWDREAGFDLVMMPFESGANIVDSLAAYNWAVAGCGAVPLLTEQLGDYLEIIAVADDESPANVILAREGSPLLAAGNTDRAGRADAVKKAEILCPRGTSAHYLVGVWLKSLGLSEKDVRLVNMEPGAALSAFRGGVGDAVALWAPLAYEAEAAGYKVVSTSRDCGITQLVLLTANREFAAAHPEKIRAFLGMYLRAVDEIKKIPEVELTAEYIRFAREWTGSDLAPETALKDLQSHLVYNLEEQIALLAPQGGVRATLDDIAAFQREHGGSDPARATALKNRPQVTDRYLKMLTR